MDQLIPLYDKQHHGAMTHAWVLQKVMKQGRNGNVGEFRHMTT